MLDLKPKLLIVDDDPAIRWSLSQIFIQLGYDVRWAEDGFSALAALRCELPDIILSDLEMPGMSGFELLSVVRRRFPAVQVIAMSGSFSGARVPDGVLADAFYEKGNDLGLLLQLVVATDLWQPTALRHSGTPPTIWVSTYRDDSRAQLYANLSCPECLRTFPEVIAENSCLVRHTLCVFCQSFVQYAILHPSGRVPAAAFQSNPATAGSGSRVLLDLN